MPTLPSDNCKGIGIKASDGAILSNEEKAFFDSIAQEVKTEKTGDNSATLAERVALRTELGIKADKFKALQQKRSAAINFLKAQEINATLAKSTDKVKALNAILVGSDRIKGIAPGGRNSVAAEHTQLFQSAVGTLKAKLGLNDLIKIFQSKDSQVGIMRELWRIGRTKEELAAMAAGDRPEYAQIAQHIHETYTSLINRANRAGAFINDLPGYIMRQSHDMDAIRKAGGSVANSAEARATNAKAWKDFISPLLDWKKIQANEGREIDADEFLQASWEALASGVHLKPTPENADTAPISFGGVDLASKVSSYRKLLFKDSDSFKTYNDKFGQKSLMDGVSATLNKLSENVALLNKLGTNPQRMFDSLTRSLRGETRLEFRDGKGWYSLERDWKYISGQSRQPLNLTGAKIGAGMRAYNVLTSLGSALFSHTTDLGVGGPAELAYQGMNPLTGFFGQIMGMFEHITDKDKRNVAYRLGVGVEGWHSNFWSSFDGAQDVSGTMAKLSQYFYSINGERPWTNAHQGAIATMMSEHMGSLRQSNFEQLPEETKRLFSLYDIRPQEWDALRRNTQNINGKTYLMPDSVVNLPDEEINAMMGGKATPLKTANYRDALESKVRNMFIDRVDYANLRPGAREMSILQFGTRPGTPEGEAMRFMAQFKAYPVAFFTKTLSRELYGRNSKAASFGAMTTIAASATLSGYAALTLSALASGKTAPDPSKWETMEASMVRGGGMGILTDYIFGQGSAGRGPADAVLGPTIGKAFNFIALYQKAKEIGARQALGEKTKDLDSLRDDFSRQIVQNIPYQNVFYIKGLFQYQVVYKLNEMLNPGYLDRMQQRMKASGQQFIIPPN